MRIMGLKKQPVVKSSAGSKLNRNNTIGKLYRETDDCNYKFLENRNAMVERNFGVDDVSLFRYLVYMVVVEVVAVVTVAIGMALVSIS